MSLIEFETTDVDASGSLSQEEVQASLLFMSSDLFASIDVDSSGDLSAGEVATFNDNVIDASQNAYVLSAGHLGYFLNLVEFNSYAYFDESDFNWYYGSWTAPPPTDPGLPQVTVSVANSANLAAAEQTKAAMEEDIRQLDMWIDSLSGTEVFAMPDGSTITGAELQTQWANISFELTDTDYGTNRGGAYDFENNVARFNFATYDGYAASPNGAEFILLQELAHGSASGQAINDHLFQSHLDLYASDRGLTASQLSQAQIDQAKVEWPDTALFEENEEFANAGALSMAEHIGLDLHSYQPTFGYEFGDLSQ